MVAANVARELRKDHPQASRDDIAARMRADLGATPGPEEEKFIAMVLRRIPARTLGSAPGPGAARPSAITLVVVNLLPLYGVVFLHWPAFTLLALFWMENVVIGVLNVARMVAVDPADLLSWGAKLFLVPSFCVHYGLFTASICART